MNPSVNTFSFPLNVYAYILEKEEGQVDYLHYGLFDHPGISAAEAQLKATETLWRHLPAPCKLLEVGIGLGTTLARLLNEGYNATGITPDLSQIAYAKSRHGEQFPVVCAKLEEFREAPHQWNALLFQESAQYIDPVDLFEATDDLLAAEGRLIVMDEFALQRAENLHYLEHFLRLAERAGFILETHIDLSALAQPTVDWLLVTVEKHSQSLIDELGLLPEELTALEASNRRYLKKYNDRQFGYFLLSFKRVHQPRWRIGRILPNRSGEMRTLFSKVFGHEMSANHWQWKYGDGRGSGIGVWRTHDNKLIAQYGGISRDVLFFGELTRACQACDVMVDAGGRGTLSRKGPAFLGAATFIERELGYGAPHLLAFGFPNDRAFRLPNLLGLYAGCGAMLELSWPTGTVEANTWLWKISKSSLATPKETAMADVCWQSMAAGLKDRIVGVRDSHYLRHRYVDHPDKRYLIFAAKHRFSLQPSGLFILCVESQERCELLDVIGPLAIIPQLINLAKLTAKGLGCTELFLWATENIAPAFGSCPTIKDLQITVPCNVWTEAPPQESLSRKWWLTGGDTDFR